MEDDVGYFHSKFNSLRKDILLYLWINQERGLTVRDISNSMDKDYSYCHKIVSEFENHELVERTKEKRKKIIELTTHGRELGEVLEQLYSKLDKLDEKID